MKTVSVSFQNRKTTLTAVFDVYAHSEMTNDLRNELVRENGITNTCSLFRDDWEDDDTARIEKLAAVQAGLENQRAFLVRKSLK